MLSSVEGCRSPLLRLKIPRLKLVADYLRVFVRTGVPWDDCNAQHEIEVDLLSKRESGSIGTTNADLLSLANAGEQDLDAERSPPVFTLPALFRLKLLAYSNRKAPRDLDDMHSILRKATAKTILESKASFKNIGVDSDVIEEIDEEYVELRELLKELLPTVERKDPEFR